MLISYNWLKQYLNLPDSITPEEVGDRLKASTVEVEAVKKMGENLENIVVGKVVTAEKHPNADKLKLCQIDVGNEKIQIVCGGSNVREGMLVALAKIGAKVKWHGEGELIELVLAKIRGVESFGMICASTEIGLGGMFPLKDEKEILDLTDLNLKPGTALAAALNLNDAVLEIDNKSLSNRPDLWGHYGIAREVAVLMNKDLGEYKVLEIEKIKKAKMILNVEVKNTKLCPRYMAVAMSGIKVGPSPVWLSQRLGAVGVNSINNIVDITNYVMLDLGQPMHAFDANLVSPTSADKKNIIVRPAENGEKLKALDNNAYGLNNSDLVIADTVCVLALAGVIGGEGSAISDKTTTIIFESANFDATTIRKTSTRLNIRTDSAQRFEKSLDPNLCAVALKKAVMLVKEICPGAMVVSSVADEKKFSLTVGPIEIEKNLFTHKLGVVVPEKEILRILVKLGFGIKEKKNSWAVTIPTWRATKDVSIKEDIVEEVLRVYGYENIPSTLPEFNIGAPLANGLRQLERNVSDILVKQFAFTEVYNYSFVSGEQIQKMGDNLESYIELENPLAKDRPYLRRNLLPNLLANITTSIDNNNEVKIFEIGKVFRNNESGLRVQEKSDELLPRQDTWLTAVFVNKKESVPYWQMRMVMDVLGQELGLEWETVLEKEILNREHPTRTAMIRSNNKPCGVMGEIHPNVAKHFGVDCRVGFLQLNLSTIHEEGKFVPVSYHSVSVYPAIERDLAIVMDNKISHAQILSTLNAVDPLLKNINLFDVFSGGNIGEDKKSMAYRFTYIHPERTLTAGEVDVVQTKIMTILKEKFQAEVRK
ncbi:MAG: phenylalanine--tRNA ligase subunit beta [bacterium]|nr:phenylalanine--tRNA ligase subunit beta [bacterium]